MTERAIEALPVRHRTFIAIIGDQDAMTRPVRVDESIDAIWSQWSERAVTFGDACMPVPIRLHSDGNPILVNPAAIATAWTETPTPTTEVDNDDEPRVTLADSPVVHRSSVRGVRGRPRVVLDRGGRGEPNPVGHRIRCIHLDHVRAEHGSEVALCLRFSSYPSNHESARREPAKARRRGECDSPDGSCSARQSVTTDVMAATLSCASSEASRRRAATMTDPLLLLPVSRELHSRSVRVTQAETLALVDGVSVGSQRGREHAVAGGAAERCGFVEDDHAPDVTRMGGLVHA